MAGFNFGGSGGGATGTSGQPAPSLFGTAGTGASGLGGSTIFGQPSGAATTNNKPLFGQALAADGASKPSGIFGAPSASSAPKTGGGLFGNTTSATPNTENKTGGGLFGSTMSGGGIFGQTKPNQPAESSKPAFAGFSAPAPVASKSPGTPSQAPPKFNFGTTTPAAPASTNIFGQPSTTPAGQPPTASIFNASTGAATQPESTSSGFAFMPAAAAPAAPSLMFGKPVTTQPSTTNTLFGQGPVSTAPSGGLFGTAKDAQSGSTPASFSFEKPQQDNKPAVPKFSPFPTTATAPSSSGPQASATPLSSGLFANTGQSTMPPPSTIPQQQTAASASASPAVGTSIFGGLSTSTGQQPQGFNPGSSAAAPSSQPNTSTPTQSSLFPTSKAPASSATATSTPAAAFALGPSAQTSSVSKPPGSLFALGASTASSAPTTAANAPNPTTLTAAQLPSMNQSTMGASTAGPMPPQQSRLRNKTMDEILTRWASDLTRYTKEFKGHAETIAQWDQIIVDNSIKIDKLYVKTRTCEKQTMSVEMQVNTIENQQNELEAWLNKYEADVDEMLAKDGPAQNEIGGPDQERERTYQLAERLGERLDDMGRDLQSMIEEVNAANANLGKSNTADEPITQIVKILNSHLSQLQAIDQGTSTLQAKVMAAQKAASGMAYLNGPMEADNGAAVDNFYRRYVGRR